MWLYYSTYISDRRFFIEFKHLSRTHFLKENGFIYVLTYFGVKIAHDWHIYHYMTMEESKILLEIPTIYNDKL